MAIALSFRWWPSSVYKAGRNLAWLPVLDYQLPYRLY